MSPAEHRPWSATDIDHDFGTVTITDCCDEHARAARLAEEGSRADQAADLRSEVLPGPRG